VGSSPNLPEGRSGALRAALSVSLSLVAALMYWEGVAGRSIWLILLGDLPLGIALVPLWRLGLREPGSPAAVAREDHPIEPYRTVEFHFGIVLLRTRRFQSLMDRLGRNRISRPTGWVLLYFMPVAGAIGFYLFLFELTVLLSPRGAALASNIRALGPFANLGLPGINPYLPIVDGWIALVVAMVIHEGAHGVVARNLGLPVKAAGLMFFLFVPIGAFVDVDEAAIKEARASHAGRVLGAGAGINFVVGMLCLLLLFGVVSAMRPVNSQGVGAVVLDGSPLSSAGIRTGDYVLSINGMQINDVSAISTASWYQIGNTVNVTVWRDGSTLSRNVTIGSQSFQNISSGEVFQLPYLGIGTSSPSASDLAGLVSGYTGSILSRPVLYLCIPTLPGCQGEVPFSDTMSGFYTSYFGPGLVPLANLLYWLFFINVNLAIFNSLPIYPLDGGQAFLVGVKALGRGRLGDETALRITGGATLAVVALILGVVAGPYLL
jgi:membrane-associated protease RseP (regulator of RpoE activity)